ncbi:MAG: gene transfer agent family protein [Pseudomonadota bacterium]|jgi:hypothetical protein
MIAHRAFFGDAEYDFRLTVPAIQELERSTGLGIGLLCERIFTRNFAQADLTETIRLALIGGGTSPKRAAELVAAYATGRPLAEIYPLASAIADATWFGKDDHGQT